MFLIIGCYQEHFLCAVLGTIMCSRFCIPETVCDIPDIIRYQEYVGNCS